MIKHPDGQALINYIQCQNLEGVFWSACDLKAKPGYFPSTSSEMDASCVLA